MRTETFNEHVRVILEPGDYYASRSPVTVSTLLGSCVAACLFDPVNHVIGMNHFMLSCKRYAIDRPMSQTEAGRYGVHAMELLLNEMLSLGAEKRFIKAKAFGGSTMILQGTEKTKFSCVGEVNSRFIREFLEAERIPILAENLGGKEGRVIHFSSGDFIVYMRRLRCKEQTAQVSARDRDCWLHAIDQQQRVSALENVEIWK